MLSVIRAAVGIIVLVGGFGWLLSHCLGWLGWAVRSR